MRIDGLSPTIHYPEKTGQGYVFHAVVKIPSSSISMIAPVRQVMDGIGRIGHVSSSAWTAANIMK